jgi:hypothetical protein
VTTGVKPEDENAWREEAANKRRDLEQAKVALEAQQKAQPAGTEAQQKAAERGLAQAQRTVAYYERRLNTFLKAAEAAKVPPAWLEPTR